MLDYSKYFEELIAMEHPILIYAGEFDAQDGPKTQEAWLRRLNFTGSEEFWSQSRQVYFVKWNEIDPTTGQAGDGKDDDGYVIGGYWRESDYFSYLTVPKSGHFVPANYYTPTL